MKKLSPLITVASRIDRLPLLSWHRKLSLVLGIGAFFHFYTIFLGGLLSIILAPLFQLNTLQTALIISASFIGMFSGATLFHIILNCASRSSLYLVTLFITSGANLAGAFAPTYSWFIILRFLAGVGTGAALLLTDIYISEMFPEHVYSRYIAWTYTLGFCGAPVVALAGQFAIGLNMLALPGWRLLLAFGALGAPIVWFLRAKLPASPRWYEIRQRSSAAHAALNQIEFQAMLELELEKLPPPVDVEPAILSSSLFAAIFTSAYKKRVLMLWGGQFLQVIGYGGFGALVFALLLQKGFSSTTLSLYAALIFAGYPCGSLLTVFLIGGHYGQKRLMGSIGLFVIIVCLCFGFTTVFPFITITGFLLTMSSNLFLSLCRIHQLAIFPEHIRSPVVNISCSLNYLTNSILPFIVLLALQRNGSTGVFVVAAVFFTIICLVSVSSFSVPSNGSFKEHGPPPPPPPQQESIHTKSKEVG